MREPITQETFDALSRIPIMLIAEERGLELEAIQQAFCAKSTIQGVAVRIAGFVPERRLVNEITNTMLSGNTYSEEVVKQLSLIRHLTSDDVINNIVEFVNEEDESGQLMLSIYINHSLEEMDARCIAMWLT